MDQEDINTLVAKERGWFLADYAQSSYRDSERDIITKRWFCKETGDYPHRKLPLYIEDLNLCYIFEESLADENFAQYMQILGTVVHEESFGVDKLCRKLPCHATSLQRCKAYLKLKKIPYNV